MEYGPFKLKVAARRVLFVGGQDHRHGLRVDLLNDLTVTPNLVDAIEPARMFGGLGAASVRLDQVVHFPFDRFVPEAGHPY